MSTAAPSPTSEPTRTASGTQAVLGVFLAVLLGLLAFRGYGAPFGARPTDPAAPNLTDLNTADRAELSQVPGLGPKMAEAIIDHRRVHGPFRSVDELRDVRGVGPLTFEKVRHQFRTGAPAAPSQEAPAPLVSTSFSSPIAQAPAPPAPRAATSSAKKIQPGEAPINVNTASLEELQRLPGVGPVMARAIVAARAAAPFQTVSDLDKVKGIGPKTLDKLRPFVVVQ
ncbi:MAG TPA: helix-hairpin-helix domain-containing protein [Gemmata sp.]